MNKHAKLSSDKVKKSNKITDAFFHMIFPHHCLSCETELSLQEKSLCSECQNNLPFTFFENYKEATPMDKLFWGRIQLESTYALLYFEKGRSSQKILHSLKYQSNSSVGEQYGKMIGQRLIKNSALSSVDLIVPVPIHPKKEFTRGYNQSEYIAKGVSESTGIPFNKSLLKKVESTQSQTKKSRFARWDNVLNNFTIRKELKKINHIAIIDDVMTTGSTVESLVRSIRTQYPELRISIICLALAK